MAQRVARSEQFAACWPRALLGTGDAQSMGETTYSVSIEFLHLPAEAFGHDDGSSRRHTRFQLDAAEYETVESTLLEAVFAHPTALSAEERSCIFRGAVTVALLTDDYDPDDLTIESERHYIDALLDDDGTASLVTSDEVWSATIGDIARAIDDGSYARTTKIQFFIGVPGGWGDAGSAGSDPWVTIAAATINLASDKLIDLALGVALSATFGKGRALIERARVRAQADFWRHKGFTTSGDLHEYIDRNQPWEVDRLATRLHLSVKEVERLLRSIGYEVASDGRWSAGTSKRAKTRRHKWLGKIAWEPIVGNR